MRLLAAGDLYGAASGWSREDCKQTQTRHINTNWAAIRRVRPHSGNTSEIVSGCIQVHPASPSVLVLTSSVTSWQTRSLLVEFSLSLFRMMRTELPHCCQELLGTLKGLLLLRQKKNTCLDLLKLELLSPVSLEMREKNAGDGPWPGKQRRSREFCWS